MKTKRHNGILISSSSRNIMKYVENGLDVEQISSDSVLVNESKK